MTPYLCQRIRRFPSIFFSTSFLFVDLRKKDQFPRIVLLNINETGVDKSIRHFGRKSNKRLFEISRNPDDEWQNWRRFWKCGKTILSGTHLCMQLPAAENVENTCARKLYSVLRRRPRDKSTFVLASQKLLPKSSLCHFVAIFHFIYILDAQFYGLIPPSFFYHSLHSQFAYRFENNMAFVENKPSENSDSASRITAHYTAISN